MLMTPTRRQPPRPESGFTVFELMVVLLVLSIVLVIAGSSLISLDHASYRNDSLIQEEQAASSVMAELEGDLRAAATITIPSGASAADEVQVARLGSGGATSNVRWVYSPSTQTLTRQVQQQGVYQAAGYSIADVANGSGTPVFRYYDSGNNDISGTTGSNIALCSTAVDVDVHVASPTSGVGTFQETSEVALTNQTEALVPAGEGPCS